MMFLTSELMLSLGFPTVPHILFEVDYSKLDTFQQSVTNAK